MEICLNITPHKQPSPSINKGGDCFVCSFVAGINYLFPENKITFEEVNNAFKYESGHLKNNWNQYESVFYSLCNFQTGRVIYHYKDVILPIINLDRYDYAWHYFEPRNRYIDRMEALLKAGWIIYHSINLGGSGPFNEKQESNYHDHLVLLDGVRSIWEPFYHEGNHVGDSPKNYVHVVCSVKGAYWIGLREWFRNHGASAWLQVRRDDRQ